MQLNLVIKKRWALWAACDAGNRCFLPAFLESLTGSLADSGDNLLAMLSRVAEQGPGSLNTEKCHILDKKYSIYQFSSSQLRLLWFYDQNNLVICTHGFVKKSRKTPLAEISQARKIRTQYFQDKDKRRLTWIDENEKE